MIVSTQTLSLANVGQSSNSANHYPVSTQTLSLANSCFKFAKTSNPFVSTQTLSLANHTTKRYKELKEKFQHKHCH